MISEMTNKELSDIGEIFEADRTVAKMTRSDGHSHMVVVDPRFVAMARKQIPRLLGEIARLKKMLTDLTRGT